MGKKSLGKDSVGVRAKGWDKGWGWDWGWGWVFMSVGLYVRHHRLLFVKPLCEKKLFERAVAERGHDTPR